MPQITVTIDDETYMNLTHFLPKGMKSRFVNMAVAAAIYDCSVTKTNIYGIPPHVSGEIMHVYAKEGPDEASMRMHAMMKRLDERQKTLGDFNIGGEEE